MGLLHKKRSSFSGDLGSDSPSPLDGVVNLSDAMLVFACGLLISIILNWNVDLLVKEVDLSESKQSVDAEDFQEMTENDSQSSVYQEMGKVYIDSETGEMYMVVEGTDAQSNE